MHDMAAAVRAENSDPAQMTEGRIRYGRLVAFAHVEHVNPAQVHKSRVRGCRLVAVDHVERLDPAQVHKGRIRVGRLTAPAHVERLDPAQVHEGCVSDSDTLPRVHRVQPCTRIASNMDEIRIDNRFASPRITAARHATRLPLIIDSASIHGKSMTASRNSLQILCNNVLALRGIRESPCRSNERR